MISATATSLSVCQISLFWAGTALRVGRTAQKRNDLWFLIFHDFLQNPLSIHSIATSYSHFPLDHSRPPRALLLGAASSLRAPLWLEIWKASLACQGGAEIWCYLVGNTYGLDPSGAKRLFLAVHWIRRCMSPCLRLAIPWLFKTLLCRSESWKTITCYLTWSYP